MDREWPELPSTQLGPTLLVIPAQAVWPLDPGFRRDGGTSDRPFDQQI